MAALLGTVAVAVVHVGSTAVPGLEAKPILDIAAAVRDQVPIDDVVARLCSGGTYVYDGDWRDDGGPAVRARRRRCSAPCTCTWWGKGSRAWADYLRFHALLCEDTGRP